MSAAELRSDSSARHRAPGAGCTCGQGAVSAGLGGNASLARGSEGPPPLPPLCPRWTSRGICPLRSWSRPARAEGCGVSSPPVSSLSRTGPGGPWYEGRGRPWNATNKSPVLAGAFGRQGAPRAQGPRPTPKTLLVPCHAQGQAHPRVALEPQIDGGSCRQKCQEEDDRGQQQVQQAPRQGPAGQQQGPKSSATQGWSLAVGRPAGQHGHRVRSAFFLILLHFSLLLTHADAGGGPGGSWGLEGKAKAIWAQSGAPIGTLHLTQVGQARMLSRSSPQGPAAVSACVSWPCSPTPAGPPPCPPPLVPHTMIPFQRSG